ncbi:hypothetical protein B0T14DRAFT_561355 [Immersiella caudata]|uniref:Uncharacterized protein n=1 Tax=Immersiella caudata TaxID=314043 RepID=A0AA39XGY5_9PEZI|nr:hypothetical protein B0T14DRAFT_561355 [Immersiella caudata]
MPPKRTTTDSGATSKPSAAKRQRRGASARAVDSGADIVRTGPTKWATIGEEELDQVMVTIAPLPTYTNPMTPGKTSRLWAFWTKYAALGNGETAPQAVNLLRRLAKAALTELKKKAIATKQAAQESRDKTPSTEFGEGPSGASISPNQRARDRSVAEEDYPDEPFVIDDSPMSDSDLSDRKSLELCDNTSLPGGLGDDDDGDFTPLADKNIEGEPEGNSFYI